MFVGLVIFTLAIDSVPVSLPLSVQGRSKVLDDINHSNAV